MSTQNIYKKINYLRLTKTPVLALIVILISASICIFSVYKIKKYNTSLVNLKSIHYQRDLIINNYKNTLENFNKSYKDKFDKLQQIRPSEEGIINFIEKLEEVGKNRNLTIQLSQDAVDSTDLKNVKYNLGLSGDFNEAVKFLSDIEYQLPYLIGFEQFNFVDDDNEQNIKILISLSIK
ncbi:hypothetical protein A2483_03375 [Candidatus Peregrinibacteria bacterium RIFOXYC2_FULL_33_13]|nr:MAG: hypothetical protein UR27_C0003G0072 [Candidatus Peregrinibacteria bacterium GW2011_GWA2_33_10]KKP40798.1 MAG: hypothetical protein UR30_C0004G0056 [Candidatus Peregrinibacteria bacterium GW2011_GWC2_33_13]OGJ48041.1 MAG: hypothetical protein A2229_03335 [Candidatus Peregrinibacteria bacterium RIFOXYA2_FULL_33_7]OGJ57013.1 MAG: hypothetical protein A2483_03375 [Candidatus Peregrinibacteria bacterium RIFOXYC2_FULL_33_13]